MTNSYWAKEQIEKLGLETVEDGDFIHIRKILSPEPLDLKEEKRLFMLLYERGIEIRAQFQHDGFWGTGMRNDGPPKQHNTEFPQGVEYYGWNKRNGEEPSEDPWPRMYTKEWLEK
jgi:hypothetical protein